jgi:transposase-like protein
MQQRAEVEARAARRERWRAVIAEAEASLETIRAYCDKHGIHPGHYYYWRRQFRQGKEIPTSTGSGHFVLVGTAGVTPKGPAALELIVERGWRLRIGAGVEERALRTVLSVLAAQS